MSIVDNAETTHCETPLKLGVCGLAYGRKNLLRLLRSPEARFVKLLAVCDHDPRRLAAAAQELNCDGYASLDALLDRPEIEAIALFTPPAGRAELIRKIIRRGKHVMTTKPIELEADAALAVLNEARRLRKVVVLNSPAPVLGEDLLQVQRWQREHDLGELIFAQTDCWYSSHEEPDGSWYDDPARCPAAPIFRLGIYGINDIIALLGEPDSLHVHLARRLTGRNMPDVGQLSLRFANGAMA
jgi:predicted dehydrogenase